MCLKKSFLGDGADQDSFLRVQGERLREKKKKTFSASIHLKIFLYRLNSTVAHKFDFLHFSKKK